MIENTRGHTEVDGTSSGHCMVYALEFLMLKSPASVSMQCCSGSGGKEPASALAQCSLKYLSWNFGTSPTVVTGISEIYEYQIDNERPLAPFHFPEFFVESSNRFFLPIWVILLNLVALGYMVRTAIMDKNKRRNLTDCDYMHLVP